MTKVRYCDCGFANGLGSTCICDEPKAERPVSPTASAGEFYREWSAQIFGSPQKGETLGGNLLFQFAEAYASSQSDKLRGLGQEAAEKLWESEWGVTRADCVATFAAIIDAEIEGRLKK